MLKKFVTFYKHLVSKLSSLVSVLTFCSKSWSHNVSVLSWRFWPRLQLWLWPAGSRWEWHHSKPCAKESGLVLKVKYWVFPDEEMTMKIYMWQQITAMVWCQLLPMDGSLLFQN